MPGGLPDAACQMLLDVVFFVRRKQGLHLQFDVRPKQLKWANQTRSQFIPAVFHRVTYCELGPVQTDMKGLRKR